MEVEFQYFFINFGYKETVFSESRFFYLIESYYE